MCVTPTFQISSSVMCCFPIFLLRLFLAVIPLLAVSSSDPECRCEAQYFNEYRNGCIIIVPAPKGFKCYCEPKSSSSCVGVALPCRADEACPGGRFSFCACMQGGGDCSGYGYTRRNFCSDVNKVEFSSSLKQWAYEDCHCKRHKEGCFLTKAAPEGFKCSCRGSNCIPFSTPCDEDEYCPAGDARYCGCMRGKGRTGDCNGYPVWDRMPCDFNGPVPRVCDCNKTSDWTQGQFSINNVTTNITGMVRQNAKPVEVGTSLDIPNNSEVAQSQTLITQYERSSEIVFDIGSRISSSIGTEFSVGLYNILSAKVTTTATAEISSNSGKKNTTTNLSRHQFPCTAAPRTYTRCRVSLLTHDISIPFTAALKHKEIPNCECPISGHWKEKSSYKSTLTVEIICKYLNDNSKTSCDEKTATKPSLQPSLQSLGTPSEYAKMEHLLLSPHSSSTYFPNNLNAYLTGFICHVLLQYMFGLLG